MFMAMSLYKAGRRCPLGNEMRPKKQVIIYSSRILRKKRIRWVKRQRSP